MDSVTSELDRKVVTTDREDLKPSLLVSTGGGNGLRTTVVVFGSGEPVEDS